MSSKTLVVVRNSYRGSDPTYACMANNVSEIPSYLMLELDNGSVSKRSQVPLQQRKVVEDYMSNFRGSVMVDRRADTGLVPIPRAPETATEAALHHFRRAKSDEEINALQDLASTTYNKLREGGSDMRDAFRGAEARNMKSGFVVTKAKGFTQYRLSLIHISEPTRHA